MNSPDQCDLTVIVMALNEQGHVAPLFSKMKERLDGHRLAYQLILVDGGSTDGTPEAAQALGVEVIRQKEKGYGRAIIAGVAAARGPFIVTMDADLSHPAEFIEDLWRARFDGDLIVASRYVPGARFDAPLARKILSRILNFVFTRALSVPVRDMSSGFRLYRADVLKALTLHGVNFEILEEILIKIYMDGRGVREIPFHYMPRKEGKSKARLFVLGVCFLKTFLAMWRLRSSIGAADYDARAYSSRIPLQRYWQRRRVRTVTDWAGARRNGGLILDIGCGSSQIIQSLPNIVGIDVAMNRLRYLKNRGKTVVQASAFALPCRDGAFDVVICSQVIEHIPLDPVIFTEFRRVLKPDGHLIVGTPDYGLPFWPLIEWAYKKVQPNGYADEHITHYTRASLAACLEKAGFAVLEHSYILKAELNMLARRAR